MSGVAQFAKLRSAQTRHFGAPATEKPSQAEKYARKWGVALLSMPIISQNPYLY
jgi:hypothetical protein